MTNVVEAAIAESLNSPHSKYETIEQIKDAAATLHQTHACTLCILRFLQIAHGPVYQDQDTQLYEQLGLSAPQPDKLPCPVCLGILSNDVARQIAEKYTAQEFDAQQVTLGIEVPKSIYVRHRSMQIFCSTNIALTSIQDVVDVKDTLKYMVAQQLANHSVTVVAECDTQIDIAFAHPESAPDCQFLVDRANSATASRVAIVTKLTACTDAEFTAHFTCPPPPITTRANISVSTKRASIFVGGRYLKLERNISQTPFIVEGRRVTEHSVSEIIGAPLQQLTKCDSYNMVGSGREDADVRMLGDGRPFYIECINPRRICTLDADICEIERTLSTTNSPVQARRLQVIRAQDTAIIKEGEENKTKHYCALVWFAHELSQEKLAEINELGKHEIVLEQKTPVRVLHRRAPLTRPRKLLALAIEHIEGCFYRVRIESEAGTYIKEFVHGDLGRTVPSLAGLADTPADIFELDVECVSLDFPPAVI
ncbi:putative tRNA pseudouridine synthase Pus10 [Coemansia sp. RSA 1822]|nr:putative tRNA pseudouridine synthase Pus10 [Coemansia sp. RSA 638]KAJ2540790.1 putative tRNA pseudouridine synthase Pus10 [Coemansia sp. RSA 1853]KAJ2560613.1 putative tRNA pseudouridine synthase Pus10 [Coemansia sp. RSA 1822]